MAQVFEVFSSNHEGWFATLEMFGTEFGAQIQERELPFEGIVAEWDEIQGNQIVILIGDRPDDHMTNTIDKPTEVSFEQMGEGAAAVLAIQSADGVLALMRVRCPMLPEIVDGLVGVQSWPPL